MNNRREFIKGASALTAYAFSVSGSNARAETSRTIKVGLIGCGYRGRGAMEDMLKAAKQVHVEIKVVALADFFAARAADAAKTFGCPEKMAFVGGTGYKNVIASDCEIVILATPPIFRPIHFEAAVKAGKQIFAEKPIAVDPPGLRRFLAAAAEAKAKGLTVVAGTQRRHDPAYLRQALAIQEGKLGPVIAGSVYWNTNTHYLRPRQPTDNNAQYMVRNWLNFREMSGDHVVEQHCHNIDIANWFIGRYPRTALAFGGRAQRKTGNQYDFFSIDYDYGDDVHIHGMCRQIAGCSDIVGELLRTPDGMISGGGRVTRKGVPVELAPHPAAQIYGEELNGQVNEQIDLLSSVIRGEPVNEGEQVAMATATGMMARFSAYTGQTVRMSDLLTNAESPYYNETCLLGPLDFESDKDVQLPPEEVAPLPGKLYELG